VPMPPQNWNRFAGLIIIQSDEALRVTSLFTGHSIGSALFANIPTMMAINRVMIIALITAQCPFNRLKARTQNR
jgi:hypothetical protein